MSCATGGAATGPVDARWLACESAGLAPRAPRLLEVIRGALRAKHYSRRTEKAYVGWIRHYIVFHGKRHPRDMGAAEASGFLTSLAVDGKVSASTQNQALAALLFLYRDVLGVELPWLDELVRARRPQRLPVVLTRTEVGAVIRQLEGVQKLMACLLHGAGLRLLECVRLRLKDIDFEASQIVVRSGKGDKDRVYTHVLNRGPGAVRSPADTLATEGGDRVWIGRDHVRVLPCYTASTRSLTPSRRT